MSGLFDLNDERGVLRTSIAVTLFIASIGIGFGLASGSFSIMFDGVYSLVDAVMGLVSLLVVNLIMSYSAAGGLSDRLRERFSMGFWHLEPMVLALNGIMLIGVALYALVNALGSILEGGRQLEFGLAIVYALITLIACATVAVVEMRANRRIDSDFVRLDVKGWFMSAGITAALLMAFCLGYFVQGTQWQWISPYIDPAILAIVCLIIIPIPVSTVRRAISDIFLVTPPELKRHVDEVAKATTERHGFTSHRSYAARIGRSRAIELYFLVPMDAPAKPVAEWDAIRDEIGHAIGNAGPDRWLTIVFTSDPAWAE